MQLDNSFSFSELKARAKRWDEKHLDALRVRKDKLFDEYKEQQKKKRREAELINARYQRIPEERSYSSDSFFRAQLQQLESRLRYSRTDKETAEKKQKILIDKDLVDFQEKLDAYEVCTCFDIPESIHLAFILAENQSITSID
jgi:structural maintenance of chromosome 1